MSRRRQRAGAGRTRQPRVDSEARRRCARARASTGVARACNAPSGRVAAVLGVLVLQLQRRELRVRPHLRGLGVRAVGLVAQPLLAVLQLERVELELGERVLEGVEPALALLEQLRAAPLRPLRRRARAERTGRRGCGQRAAGRAPDRRQQRIGPKGGRGVRAGVRKVVELRAQRALRERPLQQRPRRRRVVHGARVELVDDPRLVGRHARRLVPVQVGEQVLEVLALAAGDVEWLLIRQLALRLARHARRRDRRRAARVWRFGRRAAARARPLRRRAGGGGGGGGDGVDADDRGGPRTARHDRLRPVLEHLARLWQRRRELERRRAVDDRDELVRLRHDVAEDVGGVEEAGTIVGAYLHIDDRPAHQLPLRRARLHLRGQGGDGRGRDHRHDQRVLAQVHNVAVAADGRVERLRLGIMLRGLGARRGAPRRPKMADHRAP
jgi:hypothetical protein